MDFSVRYPVHPEDFRHYTTERIRKEFLVESLMKEDKISMVYSHFDRMIIAGLFPVNEKQEEDEKELNESYANPRRFDHLLLFPKTQWQFTKWDRTDSLGFIFSVLMVFGILLFLYIAVNLGGKIDF
jgi:hypothetical protein